MIETLSLRNFKVFREADVPLRPLTVIVGPNASGKSTILQALAFLVGKLSGGPEDLTQFALPQGRQMNDLRRFGAEGPFLVRASGLMNGATGFDLGWDFSPKDTYVNYQPAVPFHSGYAIRLELDQHKLAAPSPHQVSPGLASDGGGLATVLAVLKAGDSRQRDQLDQIVGALRAVVPTIRGLHTQTAAVDGKAGWELFFDTSSAERLPAYSASAGTLLSLGLLTILNWSHFPPKLILIEDLERGLHPKALIDLVSQLRRIQGQDEDLQIIATSHSPYLLDSFAAEEILLASLDENGHGQVHCLADHLDYGRWKDLMAPGEFWSSVGESWPTKDKKATAA